jgi:hypothetical protein
MPSREYKIWQYFSTIHLCSNFFHGKLMKQISTKPVPINTELLKNLLATEIMLYNYSLK